MKKILITGGAGYIGNVLTRDLLNDQNNIVTILDNFSYNQQISFFDILNKKNLNIINRDVRNKDILKEQIQKNDIILPLAGIVGAPACEKNKLLATELNLEQIYKILISSMLTQYRVFFSKYSFQELLRQYIQVHHLLGYPLLLLKFLYQNLINFYLYKKSLYLLP